MFVKKKANRWSKRRMRAGVSAVLGALACLSAAACLQLPNEWWYPFIPTGLNVEYNTAGPLAITNNTREDNPLWPEMAQLNLTQARLSYAMTRGQAQADVAWLYQRPDWTSAAFKVDDFFPNSGESPASEGLKAAGLTYDRVSVPDLEGLTIAGDKVVIGEAEYRALLISDLVAASPALLQKVIAVAQAGIPVLWVGGWPERAVGLADHVARDQAVAEAALQLNGLVEVVADPHVFPELAELPPALEEVQGAPISLRITQRTMNQGYVFLLFNETDADVTQSLRVNVPHQSLSLYSPEDGQEVNNGQPQVGVVSVTVPARRTRILRVVDKGLVVEGSPTWSTAEWRNPPASAYPLMRWWWPGSAVQQDELAAELETMKSMNYGGVELQTLTLGFKFADLVQEQQSIYGVGTPAYFSQVRSTFQKAAELGLSLDLTMGSGWPNGAPSIDTHPERQLLKTTVDVTGPQTAVVPVPAPQPPGYVSTTNLIMKNVVGAFDQNAVLQSVVAAKVDTTTTPPTLSDFVDVSANVSGGTLEWAVPDGPYRLFFIHQNSTSHNVVGAAYPGALASSPVIDHLNPGGLQEYLDEVVTPWLAALSPYKPRSFFVDSFELIGELPWSSGLAEGFLQQHGYDPTPYLPLLFKDNGESVYAEAITPSNPAYQAADGLAKRVREDYEATRGALFMSSFVEPLKAWLSERGILLRLQAHGGYADYLEAYQSADIPESEGLFAGGTYGFLKLASSAAHVAGRSLVTSETFVATSTKFDALQLEDYYLLMGNAFAAGINQTVSHGYAYHYPLIKQ